jgi:hypothetical protein
MNIKFWGSKLIFGNDTLINQDPDDWNAFTCKFDSLGNQTYGTNGQRDMYLVKLGQTIVSAPTYTENTKELIAYPNPTHNYVHIKEEACINAKYDDKIFDLQGRIVNSGKIDLDQQEIYIDGGSFLTLFVRMTGRVKQSFSSTGHPEEFAGGERRRTSRQFAVQ